MTNNRHGPYGDQSRGDPPLMFGARGDPDLVLCTRDCPLIDGLIFNTIESQLWLNGRGMPRRIVKDGERKIALFIDHPQMQMRSDVCDSV